MVKYELIFFMLEIFTYSTIYKKLFFEVTKQVEFKTILFNFY